MKFEIFLLGVMVIVILIGIGLHFVNLKRINDQVRATSDREFDMKALMKALQLRQGSNFNTWVLMAWSMLFVAFFFLFFLTPSVFQTWNYFERLPGIASGGSGLLTFGLGVIILSGVAAFSMPLMYRYYAVSRRTKRWMIYMPLPIILSLGTSAYLGTIYPETNYWYWMGACILLIIAEIVLLLPIIEGLVEGTS